MALEERDRLLLLYYLPERLEFGHTDTDAPQYDLDDPVFLLKPRTLLRVLLASRQRIGMEKHLASTKCIQAWYELVKHIQNYRELRSETRPDEVIHIQTLYSN